MNSLTDDRRLAALLDRLHAASEAQDEANLAYLRGNGARTTTGSEDDWHAGRDFWRDKYVALEADKARFCYALCRAIGARRVVEAGTSFGVSTLYLAAAVRDNGGGTVVATEFEADKATVARANFAEAGLADLIDLREGDIRRTLPGLAGPVQFLLLDIWVLMVRPTLELVAPLMPTGGVIVADNTAVRRRDYGELFDFVAAGGFVTQTLPFNGGLELAVKV